MSHHLSEPTPVRRVDQLLAHYALSHQHPSNEAIHLLAIPVIMLSLIGLLYEAQPWLALGFVGASMVYYMRLSLGYLFIMALVSGLMLFAVHAMGEQRLTLCTALFAGGWLAQFIGHNIEGRKPSFFEDIQYLWVGPLFVLSRLTARGARTE
ncbi:MAG: Mpo1-like protein [Betaproteobacteria bacterium]